MAFMTKEEYEAYVAEHASNVVSTEDIAHIKTALQPLIGAQFNILSIPKEILLAFEPSQIGTIIGSLMDACIPQLSKITESNTFDSVGLRKNDGILGEREGYPDYLHTSGKRLELKLLFVDNPNIEMKKPPTPREPSARLTQKVTFKNVQADKDLLLVIAYALMENKTKPGFFSPTIIDFEVFPVYDCILARDRRMYDSNGGWFGLFETPTILSNSGKRKMDANQPIDYSSYGRKENEGKDLNEDTNFGKLKRIPYDRLAADEPMIKINFGNYSAQDALNSLIGSPRGYIGSNKGELPDKLMRSRSKVILIDEFEKASKPVYNFFLQLLEEGKFTDSLGREYDLDKYIIVFTSNMPKEKIGEFLPPELRSRFNYKCAFWPLSTKEKEQYVAFKSERYLEKIRYECPEIDASLKASDIINIDVSRYSNMRDINSEIMRQITESLYEQIVK